MQKLVVKINPFCRQQQIYIYDSEQHKAPSVQVELDELNFTILKIAEEKGIDRVDLVGPKVYNRGVQNQLKQTQQKLYNKNNLEVNLI